MQSPKRTLGKRLGSGMAAPKNGNGNGNGNGSVVLYLSIGIGIITALFNAFWGVAWSSVNSNIERIEKQAAVRITAVESQAAARSQIIEAQFLRIREHDEFTRRLDSQIAKMELRLAGVATRDEVDARLGINSASIIQLRGDIGGVRAEIDKLKTDLGQTFNFKDALNATRNEFQERIRLLEQQSRGAPPKGSGG